MFDFDWLKAALRDLHVAGMARDPQDAALPERVSATAKSLGLEFVDAASNDYLGYAGQGVCEDAGASCFGGEQAPDVSRETGGSDAHRPGERLSHRKTLAATTDAPSTAAGAGASRLLGGTRPEHERLERELADWTIQPEALLFSSGYAANVGLMSSLPQSGDVIFSDALNHASIVDGCRLSKASTTIYPHRDLGALRSLLRDRDSRSRAFIVTESYFSMDGDSPDLSRLRELADEYGAALVVDEAHALGIFGDRGAGLCQAAGVVPDVLVGTLGKSVGLQGAFVAGPVCLRTWLWNRARSFVYSTATTPLLARLTLLHVKHVQSDDPGRALLHRRVAQLRLAASEAGLTIPDGSHGPIVPLILGSNARAIAAAATLKAAGILAYPVRPPTVPLGTARLRLTVTTSMTDHGLARLCELLPLLKEA